MKIKHTLKILFLFCFCITFPNLAESRPAPQNGIVREYYSNKNLRLKVRYKNGLMIRRQTFHKNGNKSQDHTYKNEKPYTRKFFHENGKKKNVWTKKSGVTKIYDKNGKFRYSM